MSKKINTLFGAMALIAGTSFVTATVVGNGDEKGEHAQPENGDKWAAMEAAWMEYATPGDEHKQLASLVGHWEMKTKMWMDPAAPPTESVNKVTVKPVLGGKYFVEHVHGDMMGMPFEGMNLMGFDKHRKQYTFAWVDNMGTGIMTGLGSANADGTEITYMSEAPDFFNAGAMMPVKSVTRLIDNDHHTFAMYEMNESGEWQKNFEGHYTRVAAEHDAGHDHKKGHDMHSEHDNDKSHSMR